uniref:Uncharacterized protein n=1 Tax=Oryza barthii TaxID=65489 RepID=A0A0D3HWF4_9ORYZ
MGDINAFGTKTSLERRSSALLVIVEEVPPDPGMQLLDLPLPLLPLLTTTTMAHSLTSFSRWCR